VSRDFSVSPSGPRIEIDLDGTWLVDGEPVVHPTVLAELVARLGRRADGSYVLRAGGGEAPVVVAEAPFVISTVAIERDGVGRVSAVRGTLTDGTDEALDLSTLRRLGATGGDPAGERLGCHVKEGRFEARFSRFATYQLLAAAEPAGAGHASLETTRGTIVL
jgi:uncharacterized protein